MEENSDEDEDNRKNKKFNNFKNLEEISKEILVTKINELEAEINRLKNVLQKENVNLKIMAKDFNESQTFSQNVCETNEILIKSTRSLRNKIKKLNQDAFFYKKIFYQAKVFKTKTKNNTLRKSI